MRFRDGPAAVTERRNAGPFESAIAAATCLRRVAKVRRPGRPGSGVRRPTSALLANCSARAESAARSFLYRTRSGLFVVGALELSIVRR